MKNKEKSLLVQIWLLLAAAVLIYISLYSVELPGLDVSRTFGIILFGLLDLLAVIHLCQRMEHSFSDLLISLCGTGIYLLYSYGLARWITYNPKTNCITAGTILCVTILTANKKIALHF